MRDTTKRPSHTLSDKEVIGLLKAMKKRNLKKYQGFTRKTVARECIIRGLTL
jgi:hypothetical protein